MFLSLCSSLYIQIVAGWGHSAVLTQNGQVLVCGRNLQGQLGLGNPNQFPKNERDHPYQVDAYISVLNTFVFNLFLIVFFPIFLFIISPSNFKTLYAYLYMHCACFFKTYYCYFKRMNLSPSPH